MARSDWTEEDRLYLMADLDKIEEILTHMEAVAAGNALMEDLWDTLEYAQQEVNSDA